ncbi:crystal protein-like [Branchiostoma floridae]|uniref:Carboxylic ester hydrolase n=1 Tax=Branchiostoma floridae TaxID=7739 RepID=A0A9J7KYB2_BRAFL|nr:crystal protein-like [Branchiostoma floridae]
MLSLPLPQLVVWFAVVAGMSATDHGPIFHTQYGDVRGVYIEEGAVVFGLPFGQPPVGELRWKPPKPFTGSWAPHIRDGSVPGPACVRGGCGPDDDDPQFVCPRDGKISEDCLYLNIFAPRTVLTNSTTKLPVMVWFHGGGYETGTGSAIIYDGRFLANKTNTVVVTTNYRLGALGFLVAGEGEDAATGNYGTLDQILALKWVQENIGNFGGDKKHVTIFGQSAGSDSVGILMTYNGSADLFEKGIMLSVPFTIYHKSRADAIRLGNHFAKQLNCSHGDIKCIRSKTTAELLDAQGKSGSFIANPFRLFELFVQWGPHFDGDILTEELVEKFAKGQFQKKPFIIGTVSEEAILFILGAFKGKMTKLELDGVAVAFMRLKAGQALREYDPPPSSDYRPVLSQAVTDWVWVCPTRNVTRSAIAGGEPDVWLYVFDHVWSFKHAWDDQPYCNGYVCHGEDIPIVFQTAPLANLSMTPDEQVLADTIAYHYGNFAHTGDPNKPNHHPPRPYLNIPDNLNWSKYSKDNGYPILNITTPQNSLMHDYRKEKCDFWDREDIYT